MKNSLLFSLALFCGLNLFSQEVDDKQDYTPDIKANTTYEIQTLAGRKGKTAHGGYFTLSSYYTLVDGKDAFMMGTRFGYLMNHSFFIGFGGSGFVSDIEFKKFTNDSLSAFFQGGYAGLYIEPVIASKSVVHVSIPILIGGGAVVYSNQGYSEQVRDDIFYDNTYTHYHDWDVIDSDVFFVVEPGLNIEFNITKFFRFGLEGKYRWVNSLQLEQTSANMLNNWSAGFSLKFGKF